MRMNLLEVAGKYSQDNLGLKLTIAKEFLHYDILDILYNNEISKKIVFQGGTALRLCYRNNRYSEDLDFSLDSDSKFSLEDMAFFKRSFEERIEKKYGLGIEFDDKKAIEAEMLNNSRIRKYIARVLLPLPNNQKSRINIEIACIPSHDNVFVNIENKYPRELDFDEIMLRVESKEEIFADKVIAFAGRDSSKDKEAGKPSIRIKYRDFWDIKFLSDQNVPIRLDLIKKKIKDYQMEDFEERLKERIDFVKNNDLTKEFETELNRFLDPNRLKFVKENLFFNDIKRAVFNTGEQVLNALQEQKPKIHIIKRR